MLGKIIENVTGESYFDYINKHVYAKADMRNSGSFDLDVPVKNTARNYWFSVETGQITENLMFQSVKGGPAGGGIGLQPARAPGGRQAPSRRRPQ